METAQKFLVPGVIFTLTLVTGLWLSHLGKPYNTLAFTIHKLIALGTVVYTLILVSRALKTTEIQALLIALIALAVVSVLALFVSGALMIIGKPDLAVFKTIHQVAPGTAVLAVAAVLYLLARRGL